MHGLMHIQQSARAGEAIAILNNVRHCLTGRRRDRLPAEQIYICRQALQFEDNGVGELVDEGTMSAMAIKGAFEDVGADLEPEERLQMFGTLKGLLDGIPVDVDQEHNRGLIHLVERSMDRINHLPV